MMDYGLIEIINGSTYDEPSWEVTSEHCGYLTDSESLDDAIAYLRCARAEGHSFDDGIVVELEQP